MKISIITVSYNSAKTIEDTIKSVISQDYPNIEYIIIDGASTDQTQNIIKKYDNYISKWISEKDYGIYDAMNKGIALATGDIIGILNSDDFYAHANVISTIANTFQNNKNIEACYGNLKYVHPEQTHLVKRKWISGKYTEGLFLKGWMPPHPTFFIKKSCYDQYGTYLTELRNSSDYELMLRMLHKNKIRVYYINQFLVIMRLGGASNSSIKNRLIANREDRLAWKLNDLRARKDTFIRKPLSKLGQYFYNS